MAEYLRQFSGPVAAARGTLERAEAQLTAAQSGAAAAIVEQKRGERADARAALELLQARVTPILQVTAAAICQQPAFYAALAPEVRVLITPLLDEAAARAIVGQELVEPLSIEGTLLDQPLLQLACGRELPDDARAAICTRLDGRHVLVATALGAPGAKSPPGAAKYVPIDVMRRLFQAVLRGSVDLSEIPLLEAVERWGFTSTEVGQYHALQLYQGLAAAISTGNGARPRESGVVQRCFDRLRQGYGKHDFRRGVIEPFQQLARATEAALRGER